MPEPVAAPSPAAPVTTPASEATTLATSEVAPAPGADAAAIEAAAKAEAERVAALTPEAKAKEEADAKAKTEAEAKKAADAETARRAALTSEQRKAEDDAKAKSEADAKAKEAADRAKRAPEKYALTLPENMAIDAEVSGKFETAAKKLGLTQEEAQELYAIGAEASQKSVTELLTRGAQVQAEWLEQAKADKEFGGENLAKNMATAKAALKFASPELKKVLNETKFGDHPELIRWMYRVGKAMSEDSFVTGSRPQYRDETEAARAKRLYPNQQ